MKIKRHSLNKAFLKFAKNGNGILIGSPGVGKTFLLKNFCKQLIEKNIPCLYLPIDKLGVENDVELRGALDIKEDLIGYLKKQNNNANKEKGFLIIDALDAARSPKAQAFFLGLVNRSVKELKDHYNIVISIRTYDAKKSEKMKDLFPRLKKDEILDDIFVDRDIKCRNFRVPELTETEVNKTINSISKSLLTSNAISSSLKKVLRIPFNLWLLDKIYSDIKETKTISSLTSEVQILDLFWKYRIMDSPEAIDLRCILTRVTKAMVDKKTLSVRIDEMFQTNEGRLWDLLRSLEILSDTAKSGQRVSYSHNILFDFVVSVLLLEENSEELIKFINEDPSRPFFLRPSFIYYFTRLWYDSPEIFWENSLNMISASSANVRISARLMPASVVVTESSRKEQLYPILKMLFKNDDTIHELIFRVLQALFTLGTEKTLLWTWFLEEISKNLNEKNVWNIAQVTRDIFNKNKGKKKIRQICGRIIRNLMEWVLNKRKEKSAEWLNSLGSSIILPLVIETYNTDKKQSNILLEKILEILKEEDFPIEFLFRLSTNIDKLIKDAPDLVSKIYLSILSHKESSGKQTSFGPPTITFLSTRRQDFEMCQYNLMKHFPKFLKAYPLQATDTVIDSLNQYIIDKNIIPYLKKGFTEEEKFDFSFRDGKATIMNDMSYIWDRSSIREAPIKMANDLFNFIDHLAEEGNFDLLDKVIDLFRDKVLVAFFWKELLRTGAKKPKVFADRLFELCLAKPILISSNTLVEVGMFLEEASAYFSKDQIKNIEESVIGLPKFYQYKYGSKDSKDLKNIIERLIARIPEKKLVTKEAKKIRASMKEKEKIPKNKPLFEIKVGWESQRSFDFMGKEDLVKPIFKNKKLKDLYSKVENFSTKWRDASPPQSELSKALDAFESIYDILKQKANEDENVLGDIWTELASSANLISRTIEDPKSKEYKFCRKVLLECAKHPSPETNPKYDENYNYPGWSPAPRNEAAQALPILASMKEDKEIVQFIGNLIKDKVPSVRYLAARYLFLIFDKNTESFWKLAKYIANNEENMVVQNALCHSLVQVGEKDKDQTVEVLSSLVERIGLPNEDSDLMDSLTALIISLCIVFNDRWAKEEIMKVVNEPLKNSNILNRLAFHAMSYVKIEILYSKDKELIDNAIKLLGIIIKNVARELKNLQEKLNINLEEKEQSKYKDLYMVFDEIIFRIYINTGIKDDKVLYPEDKLRAFYNKIKSLLRIIEEDIIIHPRTALHLMEFLNVFLKFDPKLILHLAALTVKRSKKTGFQIDTFAIREVVKLVEVILADHRKEVQHPQALEDLLYLLDIFCEAGWPEAIRLVWRLDEIFR